MHNEKLDLSVVWQLSLQAPLQGCCPMILAASRIKDMHAILQGCCP